MSLPVARLRAPMVQECSEREEEDEETIRSGAREMPFAHPCALRGLLAHGEILADTYRVGGILGAGGMGCVYEAEDLRLVRQVAIKVANDAHLASLSSEAHALAAIKHPGVVAIHAMGSHRGKPFLVMERLHGRSLQQLLDANRRRRKRFSIEEVLDILLGITDALVAVHRAGIAHRDLKPGNVVLAGERIVLVDFGLFVPESSVGTSLSIAGSGEFIAPEVIRRDVKPGGGPLIDLYALGIMAYELLVGRTPFVAATFEKMMHRHLEEVAPPVDTQRSEVPNTLARLIDELLRKDPAERPGNSEEVFWRLSAVRRPTAAGVRALRVMVVDDDPSVASTLRRALKPTIPQLSIETETDPVQGLAEIERWPPDLVLLDLDTRGMNGIELAMAIAAMPSERRPRMVGMGNDASATDVELLQRLGAETYVAKDTRFLARLSSLLLPPHSRNEREGQTPCVEWLDPRKSRPT
ncbi:MAG: protein kinase domain-containing protein [Polyangiales bacterium]